MSEDRFLEQVRAGARHLRYEPDDAALTRLAARIRARIERPAVSEWIAAWFRPLAASLTAVALAAALGLAWMERSDNPSASEPPQYSVAGDVYSVGD